MSNCRSACRSPTTTPSRAIGGRVPAHRKTVHFGDSTTRVSVALAEDDGLPAAAVEAWTSALDAGGTLSFGATCRPRRTARPGMNLTLENAPFCPVGFGCAGASARRDAGRKSIRPAKRPRRLPRARRISRRRRRRRPAMNFNSSPLPTERAAPGGRLDEVHQSPRNGEHAPGHETFANVTSCRAGMPADPRRPPASNVRRRRRNARRAGEIAQREAEDASSASAAEAPSAPLAVAHGWEPENH